MQTLTRTHTDPVSSPMSTSETLCRHIVPSRGLDPYEYTYVNPTPMSTFEKIVSAHHCTHTHWPHELPYEHLRKIVPAHHAKSRTLPLWTHVHKSYHYEHIRKDCAGTSLLNPTPVPSRGHDPYEHIYANPTPMNIFERLNPEKYEH
jgi:hypothetical protein